MIVLQQVESLNCLLAPASYVTGSNYACAILEW